MHLCSEIKHAIASKKYHSAARQKVSKVSVQGTKVELMTMMHTVGSLPELLPSKCVFRVLLPVNTKPQQLHYAHLVLQHSLLSSLLLLWLVAAARTLEIPVKIAQASSFSRHQVFSSRHYLCWCACKKTSYRTECGV